MQDNEVRDFLNGLESQRGGKITFKTATLFYGDSDGIVRPYGVFFYRVKDEFWYQDFKNERTLLGLKIGSSAKEPEYVKFESFFCKKDVESLRKVSLSKAKQFCQGSLEYSRITEIGKIGRFFRDWVTEVKLKSGKVMYFRFMDDSFEKELEK